MREALSLASLREDLTAVEGINAKLAVLITSGVGTMACAWVFAAIALISLPDALSAGRAQLVSWIAQTFLQLVLLSIILVGQRVQATASDTRSARQFEDTEIILDRLDTTTTGGLKDVLAAIRDVQHQTRVLASERTPSPPVTLARVVLRKPAVVPPEPAERAEVLPERVKPAERVKLVKVFPVPGAAQGAVPVKPVKPAAVKPPAKPGKPAKPAARRPKRK